MIRKLASIQIISDIQSIPDADMVVKAKINGWWVVTAIANNFSIGDRVIYIEIDAFVPDTIAPFLSDKKNPPVEYKGVIGKKLSTRKIRGQISQGLIMPLSVLPENYRDLPVGEDVSSYLGIIKYTIENFDTSMGEIVGSFPFFIKSTDLERIQNCFDEIKERYSNHTFEVTMKMDGASLTAYFLNGNIGVCSKEIEYVYCEKNFHNPYVYHSRPILSNLVKLGRNIAVQGELCGNVKWIKNNEHLSKPYVFIFNIFDIDEQRSFLPEERRKFVDDYLRSNMSLVDPNVQNIYCVEKYVSLNDFKSIEDLLEYADGPAYGGDSRGREGIVFKSNEYNDDGNIVSFKIISNKFLLKEGWQ